MIKNQDQVIAKLNLQIETLKRENLLLKKLHTITGFFEHYYSLLPKHERNLDAFNEANEDYYELFNEYRYANYYSFSNQQIKRNKCKKK